MPTKLFYRSDVLHWTKTPANEHYEADTYEGYDPIEPENPVAFIEQRDVEPDRCELSTFYTSKPVTCDTLADAMALADEQYRQWLTRIALPRLIALGVLGEGNAPSLPPRNDDDWPDTHPMQPITIDEDGVIRFRSNKIVCHLISHGSIDLNEIARLGFPAEDQRQLAQLIGYSVSGYGDLSYVDADSYLAADEAVQAFLAACAEPRTCKACGCTDDDCSGCIERTGEPCYWVSEDLCSACVDAVEPTPPPNPQSDGQEKGNEDEA